MTIDDIAIQSLAAFAEGGSLQGGVGFEAELRKAQLDFSLESIVRLDRLLDAIRTQLKPRFDQFLESDANQNFLNLLAFYICTVAGRWSGVPLRWRSYDEMVPIMRRHGRDFPQSHSTFICCEAGAGQYLFPLSPIGALLFETRPDQTLREYVEQVRRTAVSEPVLIRRPAGRAAVVREGTAHEAAAQLGFLAAWALQVVAGGDPLMPILMAGNTLRQMMDEKAEAGIAAARAAMHNNTERAASQVLVYDGYSTTKGVRCDAMVLEARAYKPHFRFLVSAAYFPAASGKPFTVSAPRVLECTAPAGEQAALFESFYAGVERCKGGGELWLAKLIEQQ